MISDRVAKRGNELKRSMNVTYPSETESLYSVIFNILYFI